MLAKKPPPEGARIGPSIITRVKTAWCHKRSSIDVTQSGMAARTTGATAAATPWKTRPITNQTNVSAHAQQKVLATSSTWQHRIMMRRPMKSDKGPRNNMQTAEVNRWIWIVAPIATSDTPNSLAMSGMLGWYWSVQKKSRHSVEASRMSMPKLIPRSGFSSCSSRLEVWKEASTKAARISTGAATIMILEAKRIVEPGPLGPMGSVFFPLLSRTWKATCKKWAQSTPSQASQASQAWTMLRGTCMKVSAAPFCVSEPKRATGECRAFCSNSQELHKRSKKILQEPSRRGHMRAVGLQLSNYNLRICSPQNTPKVASLKKTPGFWCFNASLLKFGCHMQLDFGSSICSARQSRWNGSDGVYHGNDSPMPTTAKRQNKQSKRLLLREGQWNLHIWDRNLQLPGWSLLILLCLSTVGPGCHGIHGICQNFPNFLQSKQSLATESPSQQALNTRTCASHLRTP